MHLFGHPPFEVRFLIAAGITVIVETAVILCIIRLGFKIGASKVSWGRILFAGFFASFATLPYLWFVLPAFIHSYALMVAFGELGVFLLEAGAYVFLLNLPAGRTLILSFAANIASILVGLLLVPPF
jgi:hypothetical protein